MYLDRCLWFCLHLSSEKQLKRVFTFLIIKYTASLANCMSFAEVFLVQIAPLAPVEESQRWSLCRHDCSIFPMPGKAVALHTEASATALISKWAWLRWSGCHSAGPRSFRQIKRWICSALQGCQAHSLLEAKIANNLTIALLKRQTLVMLITKAYTREGDGICHFLFFQLEFIRRLECKIPFWIGTIYTITIALGKRITYFSLWPYFLHLLEATS